MKPPRKLRLIEPTLPWQQEILATIENEPDDRTIYWYWSRKGHVGKTSFAKYLVTIHKGLILGGKAADCRMAIVEQKKATGMTPDLIVVNIPRSFSPDYVSYEAFENIKDMLFYSGKYEGGMICGPPPHLIVFANFEPPRGDEKISDDRWVVREITTPPFAHSAQR